MLSRLGDFWYKVLSEGDIGLAHKLAHLPLQCRVLRQAESLCEMLGEGAQFRDNFLLIRFKDEDVIWFGKKEAIQKQHVTTKLPSGETGNSRLLDLTIPDHTLLGADDGGSVAVPWNAVAFANPGEDVVLAQGMHLKFGLAVDPNIRITSIRARDGKLLYEYQDFVSEYGKLYFYLNPITLFPRMEFMAQSYEYRRRNLYCYPLGVDVYGPVDRILYYTRISQSPKSLYRAAAQAAGIPVARADAKVVAVTPLNDGVRYYTSDGRMYDADFPHTHLKKGAMLKEGEVIGGKEIYHLVLPGEVIPGNITYINLDCALPVKGLRAPNKTITTRSGTTSLRPAFEGDVEALEQYYEWLKLYDGKEDYSRIPESVNGITLVRDYLCPNRVVIACVNVYHMTHDMYMRLVAFLRRELPLGSVLCTAPLAIPIDEDADIEEPTAPEPFFPLNSVEIGDISKKRDVNVYWWQWDADLIPFGMMKRLWVRCADNIPEEAYKDSFYLGVWQETRDRDGVHFQRIATSRESQKLGRGARLEYTFRDTPIMGRTLRFAPLLNPNDDWWPVVAKLSLGVDDAQEDETEAYSWELRLEKWRVIGNLSYESGKVVTEPTRPEEELMDWLLQFSIGSDDGPIGEVDLSSIFDVEDPELREKYKGFIDWGDGSPRTEITPDMPPEAWKHEYTGEGPYNLGLNGQFSANSGEMADTGLGPFLRGMDVLNNPITDWAELKETPDTFHGLSFQGCPNLEGVTGDLYDNLSEEEKEAVKDLEFGENFKGCESLKEVPSGLFDFPALDRLDATSMFEGCTGLSEVPSNLFPHPPADTLITERMFAGCTGLQGEVPPFLTQEKAPSKLWDAEGMFEGDAGLTGVVPDFFVLPPGGELVFTDMFRGCTGLSGITEPDYDFFTDADRKTWVDGMFFGCSGLNTEIPDMWNHFTDPQTEHTDCFKEDWNAENWEEVPMDWGGEEQFQVAVLFTFQISTPGETINLSAWFKGAEEEHQGRIKWGDHSPVVAFTSEAEEDVFSHSFAEAGEYVTEVTHTPGGQDYLRMNGLLSSIAPVSMEESAASLREHLTRVDMREQVKMKYVGDGIFDGCTKLSFVVWPKLFLLDFAWEEDERFKNRLGLKLDLTTTMTGQWVDLYPWLHDEEVKVSWGDGSGSSFGEGVSEGVYRHQYAVPGEYVVVVYNSPYGEKLAPITLKGKADASLAKALTGVDVDEGIRVKYEGNSTFYGAEGLTSFAWEKMFKEAGEVNGNHMFYGCLGLPAIPGDVFFTDEVSLSDVTSMFEGCTGVTGELPPWWENWEAVPHENCFTHCTGARNFPMAVVEGWAMLEGASLTLLVTTPSEAYALDLNARLSIYAGAVNTPAIGWGDDGTTEMLEGADLSHTYAEAGEYRILIVGEVKMKGTEEKDGLCEVLSGVELETEKSGLASAEGRLFYQCEGLTSVPTGLFNGLKEETDLSYGFSGSGLKEVPEGLLSSIPPEAGPLTLDYLFANCPSLASVPQNLLPIETEIGSMVGMFEGNMGITEPVPEWWKNEALQALPHEDFFADCKAAENWVDIPEDWGGEEKFAEAALFTITTTEENQELNLAAWYKGDEEEHRGKIKWGNRTPMTVFDSTSPEETFKHTYATPGEYVVEVAHATEQEYVRMNGLLRSAYPESVASIRAFLTTVDMREVTPIKYMGDGIFDGCTLLHSVAWEKLFQPDFAWEGEEVLSEALRLKFNVSTPGEVVDISAWFARGAGKIRWIGETRSVATFAPDSDVEVFRHNFEEAGEYWVEVGSAEAGGVLRVYGLNAAAEEESVAYVREHLLAVDVKGRLKLEYDADGTFAGCTALSFVAWRKLFLPDFSWDDGQVEEMFPNALKLKMVLMSPEIDLSAWFQGLGYGRLKWGDHSGILEFTPETPAEEFKHTYDREGEHFLEVAPAEGQDRLKMRGLLSSDALVSVSSIRGGLEEVDVRGEVNFEYTGDGVFDVCTHLSFLPWSKLFNPELVLEAEAGKTHGVRFLLVNVTSADLSAWFPEAQGVKISWGDYSPTEEDVFSHTYAEAGDYWVEVSGEEVTMQGLLSPGVNADSVAFIREHLTAVEVRGEGHVKFTGAGVFDGCTKLARVSWARLFSRDYAWDGGEEMFTDFLFIRIAHETEELDLSAWLAGGSGKVKWGDHGEVQTYTPETPAEELKHTYDRAGEHVVQVSPADGSVTLNGLLSNDNEVSTTTIRSGVREFRVVGGAKLAFTGTGIFDGCAELAKVSWDKLFDGNEN